MTTPLSLSHTYFLQIYLALNECLPGLAYYNCNCTFFTLLTYTRECVTTTTSFYTALNVHAYILRAWKRQLVTL